MSIAPGYNGMDFSIPGLKAVRLRESTEIFVTIYESTGRYTGRPSAFFQSMEIDGEVHGLD